jgi:AcrR family transcriptional regulator
MITRSGHRTIPGSTPRRDEVARATAETIARYGLARTSLREIAARLGTSVGVLTHQFRDRDQLLLYAFDAITADLTARARTAMRGQDPRSAITRGLSLALPLDARSRVDASTWLAFAAAASTSPDLATAYASRWEEWAGGLEELVRAVADGPDRPPSLTAELLLAATDGIATRALASDPRLTPARQRALLREAVDALLGGPTHRGGVAR